MRYLVGGLAAIAVLAAAPAHATWIEARTEHFVIDIDADEAIARNYAIRLERFDAALRRLYGVPDDPTRKVNPLRVYVLSEAQFEKTCNCTSVAGYYVPSAAGSAMVSMYRPNMDEKAEQGEMTPQVVMLHEYSHHFMYSSYPLAYPLWYSEGFAEFNANVKFDPDGAISIGYPANYRAWSIKNDYTDMPVRDFFSPPSYFSVSTLYGRGWLMTHYLTLEPTRRGQLDVYLQEFNKGKTSLQAAQIAFGDINKLYGEMFAYRARKTGLAKPLRVPPSKTPPQITLTNMSTGAGAMVPFRIQLASDIGAKRARDLVKDAARVAARYPDDARAQGDLAALALVAGNLDQADGAADRALGVAANDRDAMLVKGQVATRRLVAAKATDAATWSAARAWFLKANKLAPDAALPLVYFYQSFLAAKQKPSVGAVNALKRAAVLVPEDSNVRMLLARNMLREGDGKTARFLLQPLAFSPHPRSNEKVARTVVGLIDAGNDADALKAMDTAADESGTKKD